MHNFWNAFALLEIRELHPHFSVMPACITRQCSTLRVYDCTHCAAKILFAMRILFKNAMCEQWAYCVRCLHCTENPCRFYRFPLLRNILGYFNTQPKRLPFICVVIHFSNLFCSPGISCLKKLVKSYLWRHSHVINQVKYIFQVF